MSVLGHTHDRFPEDRRFESKEKQGAGKYVCRRCGAFCQEKHWYMDNDQLKQLVRKNHLTETLCPGCDRIDRRLWEGEVILESPLLEEQKDTVMALIKHTEGKAWHDNPHSRIAEVETNKGRMRILTTTKWLAQRIGKQFYKSFKGELELKPAHREKFIRVYWSRKEG